MPRISPMLWFDTQAEEAAKFYVSVFPNSEIRAVAPYTGAGPGPVGSVMVVDFVLDGQEFTALNGGPQFTFNEAISLVVSCADQAEIDYYWSKLSDGGEEGVCGWLKDRYGVSWQVVPTSLIRDVLAGPDRERAHRAMQAVMTMKKLDVASIMGAADAVSGAAAGR